MGTGRASNLLPAILLVASIACREQPAPPPAGRAAASPPPPANLAGALHGAVVLDRSGEYALDASAFLMLDSDPETYWATPPQADDSWAIVRLSAPARLQAAGVSFRGGGGSSKLATVRFESSSDGTSFTPLGSLEVKAAGDRQMARFAPVEAEYVRVTIDGTAAGAAVASLPTLELEGDETAPWSPPVLSGRWKIGDLDAEFSQAGNRVSGMVGMKPEMVLDGGWSGRMVRFAWVRGPQFGYAVAGVTADGKKLDGCTWFEKAQPYFLWDSWFGDRVEEGSRPEPSLETAEVLLRRLGRAPLFGLAFDDRGELDPSSSASALDEITAIVARHPESRFVLRAYELREPTPEANQAGSERVIASLRKALAGRVPPGRALAFEAKGPSDPDAPVDTELQRVLYSRVDLALVR